MPKSAWIQQGHAMDLTGTGTLQTKSDVLNTIQHGMLPIYKNPGIIECDQV